ncbi:hypothetical protein FCV25MIE_25334, partial [Fagus crenata]
NTFGEELILLSSTRNRSAELTRLDSAFIRDSRSASSAQIRNRITIFSLDHAGSFDPAETASATWITGDNNVIPSKHVRGKDFAGPV